MTPSQSVKERKMKRKEATEKIRTRQLKKCQETTIQKDETMLRRDEKRHLKSARPPLYQPGRSDSRKREETYSYPRAAQSKEK